MTVQFFFTNTSIGLTERTRLKNFIEEIFKNRKIKLLSLTIIFCTDDYLLDINKNFLQHDFYTDIITFNLSDQPNTIEGEIYISSDRIKENAVRNKVTIKEELHRVVFHGVLHLCGFKDKSRAEKATMTKMENNTLREYFL